MDGPGSACCEREYAWQADQSRLNRAIYEDYPFVTNFAGEPKFEAAFRYQHGVRRQPRNVPDDLFRLLLF